MNWSMLEDLYLSLRGIFDGFVNFLYNIFGKDE